MLIYLSGERIRAQESSGTAWIGIGERVRAPHMGRGKQGGVAVRTEVNERLWSRNLWHAPSAAAAKNWSPSTLDAHRIAMAAHGTAEPEHFRATYNDIHNLIRARAPTIQAEFKPDMFIAIGTCVCVRVCRNAC
jgi:hypothetical protein